jgi:hypothetical protein
MGRDLLRLPARPWVCYNSPKSHSIGAGHTDQSISVNPDFNESDDIVQAG